MPQSSASVTQVRAKGYASLRFRAGEDVTIAVDIDELDGTAEDLNGDDLIWVMIPSNGHRAVLRKTIGDGITVTDESGGQASIAVTSDNTKNLEAGTYRHELWLKQADGDYETIFISAIRLQAGFGVGTQSSPIEVI